MLGTLLESTQAPLIQNFEVSMHAGVRCHSIKGIETSGPWCFHSFIIDWRLGPRSHCNFSSFLPAKLLNVLSLSLWTVSSPLWYVKIIWSWTGGGQAGHKSPLYLTGFNVPATPITTKRIFIMPAVLMLTLYSSRSLSSASGLMILNLKTQGFFLWLHNLCHHFFKKQIKTDCSAIQRKVE